MDQDLVVQHLIRIAWFVGSVIAFTLFATWLAGWLCRRAKASSGVTFAAQALTPLAVLYGLSLYLDVAGHVVQARVTSTEERIAHHTSGRTTPGGWSRSFWANVEFETPEGPGMAPLWIDAATYDALMPGASIAVRYLPVLPFIARPADQSTLAFVPWRWLGIAFAAAAAIVVLRRIMRPLPGWVKAFTILAGIGGAILWLVFPSPWLAPLESPVLTAQAEVKRVREETRSFTSGRTTGSVPAPQPWNVVELRFIPEGRTKPVIAVDSVDAGSVPNLQAGAHLPITYSKNNPREARLAGTRTWRWKEWRELAEWAVVGLVMIALVSLLGKVVGAWWRRATSPS